MSYTACYVLHYIVTPYHLERKCQAGPDVTEHFIEHGLSGLIEVPVRAEDGCAPSA